MSVLELTASGIEQGIESWRPRLLSLDVGRVQFRPSPERWTISEVIGHLCDSACNNHQRFVRAQHCDSLVFPKYEQNEWVADAGYAECEWEPLVQFWYHYNGQLAALMRRIPVDQLSTPCKITPYETCTLEFLVVDYLDHLNHHLSIIEKRLSEEDSR